MSPESNASDSPDKGKPRVGLDSASTQLSSDLKKEAGGHFPVLSWSAEQTPEQKNAHGELDAEHAARILVVEDDLAILDLVEILLQSQGYVVSTASDGERALELFEIWNPDLIILDLMLPKLDGLAFCRKVRESSNVPIIVLSARAMEEDKVWALDLGANDYMTKPFGAREFLARIRALLRFAAAKQGGRS